jgi:drug/metabolite transporter (DMT)-like permease
MLAVVLALLSAIGFGGSDFTAGLASRTTSVIRVTILGQVAAALLIAIVAPIAGGGGMTEATVGWSVVAGIAGVAGAMTLYLGFRYAQFSVASTLSAVGSAALSVVAGLLLGERPGTLALTGIALAIPAIAAVSASPGGDAQAGPEPERAAPGRPSLGVVFGLVAGVCFALYFVGLDRAGNGKGLWPVLVAQFTALAVVTVIGAVTRELGLPAGGARLKSALTGVIGIAGTTFFFLASREGLLAVTAVITSLYPGGTILLARLLLGERLSRMRLAGLALAAASVALIAVAGSG